MLEFNINDPITDLTFLPFAANSYCNVHCTGLAEFQSDIKMIQYARTLMRKHNNGQVLQERRILNYIITLTNIFEPEAIPRLMFFKCEPPLHGILLPFLEYLSISKLIPEVNINNIIQNTHVIQSLEKL